MKPTTMEFDGWASDATVCHLSLEAQNIPADVKRGAVVMCEGFGAFGETVKFKVTLRYTLKSGVVRLHLERA